MAFPENNGCTFCGSDAHMTGVCPWKGRTLTFDLRGFIDALENVRSFHEMSADLIAQSVFEQAGADHFEQRLDMAGALLSEQPQASAATCEQCGGIGSDSGRTHPDGQYEAYKCEACDGFGTEQASAAQSAPKPQRKTWRAGNHSYLCHHCNTPLMMHDQQIYCPEDPAFASNSTAAQSVPADESSVVKVARDILAILQHPTRSVTALDMWKLEDALKAHDEAAQSAPAGEREAFEAYRDERNAALEAEGHKPGSKWHVTQAHNPTWEAGAAWQRAKSAPAVPEGYVLVPVAATAENGAKAALLGEFTIQHQATCSGCYYDEADEDCEVCGGEVHYTEHVTVPWDTIKEIYAEAVRVLAAAPAQPAAQDDDTPSEGWPAYHKRKMTTMLDLMRGLRDRYKVRLAAAHDQGEVQTLREALENAKAFFDNPIARRKLSGVMIDEARQNIRAALAASTGQEVKE